MQPDGTEPSPAPASATIVAADAVDKLTALEVIATTLGAPIARAGAEPAIPLGDGVWATIEIPKFGEPPPLTIDVFARGGVHIAQAHARALADALAETTTWSISLMFED